MDKEKKYWVLAYYCFTEVKDPHSFIRAHKKIIQDMDLKCRVYISEEGINGQLSALDTDAKKYMDWLKQQEGFEKTDFKVHIYHENVFPRQTVKYREQLVALDLKVHADKSSGHVSPKKWRDMLESGEDYLILDVRNDYETKIGHFEGAECPPLKTFRDFNCYAEGLKEQKDPKQTKVMMYCTGGIRCELYSEVLREKGFDEVYQLDGGIIKYGLEQEGKHYKGKLFVFDDRLAIPLSEDAEIISSCSFCEQKSDQYYNCANMDCNELFLACEACLEKLQGCCCNSCQEAPRVRPLSEQQHSKPFRRYHYIRDQEKCQQT